MFCLVVGGLNAGDDKESKKAIIVLDDDADTERFSGLIIEWLVGKSTESFLEARDKRLSLFEGEAT